MHPWEVESKESAAVDVLAPSSMALERIEAEITELAGHLAAAECRWLQLVAEFDERVGYEQWGCRTCAHWLNWHCGLDLRSAREKLRVGHALAELPRITEKFAVGLLSYSKVRALTRIATPGNESDLVMLAEHATAAQVERSVRAYRGVLSNEKELEQANARHEAQAVHCDWDDDGMLEVVGRLAGEAGAVFLAAIDALRRSGSAANNAQALLLMAENALTSGPHARKGNERYLVVINVDEDVLTRDDTGGVCEIDGGPAIPPETARRLACDASIVWMLRNETGQAINVSAKAPSIPRSLRRAVHARDKGCRFPGCGERRFVDVHHVRHREHGGLNEMRNLLELCWFHHRLVHEGGWRLLVDAVGVLTAVDPNGNPLPLRSAPAAESGALQMGNRRRGAVITSETAVSKWCGEPLDLDHIVTALQCIDRRSSSVPGRSEN